MRMSRLWRIAAVPLMIVMVIAGNTVTTEAGGNHNPPPPNGGQECYDSVDEYKYKRPKMVTQERFEKFVSGVIEKKQGGNWVQIDTFVLVDYPDAGPLAWGQVPNPMSGPHSSVFNQTGNNNGATRYRSTSFQYEVIDTRPFQDGWEYTDWVREQLGAPWVLIDHRIEKDAFPCPVASATPGTCDAPGVLTLNPESSPYFTWSVDNTNLAAVTATVNPGSGVTIPVTSFGPFDISQQDCGAPTQSVQLSCGSAEMSFVNTTRHTYVWEYRFSDTLPSSNPQAYEGQLYIPVVVGPGGSVNRTMSFVEDDPNPWFEYRLRNASPGAPTSPFFDWVRVDVNVDCEPNEVDPNPVGSVELSCEAGINVPYGVNALNEHEVSDDVEFVVKVNGEVVKTESLAPGENGAYTTPDLNAFEDETLTVELYADGELIDSDTLEVDCVERPDPTTREESVPSKDCNERVVSTTVTKFETPWVWDAESGTYVPGEEVQVGDPVVTTRPATDEECPRTTTTTAPPTTTTTAPPTGTLPRTGNNTLYLVIGALACVATGVVVLFARRRMVAT